MITACECVEREAQPVLSIRTHTPVQGLKDIIGKAYGEIARHLGSQGMQPAGAPFIIYYNMDMDHLDIEVGFPVAGPVTGQGEIHSNQIPAGSYATCLYTGPYEGLAEPYDALGKWMGEQGFQPTGKAIEFYFNDPVTTPKEELKTQVLFELQP